MPGPRRNHLRRDEPARRSPGQSTINLAWGYYYNPRWPAKRPSYRPWSMGIGVCPTRRPRSRETAGPLARWSAGVREVGVATKSSARRVPPPAVNVADLLNLSTSSTPGQVRHCQSDGARSPPPGPRRMAGDTVPPSRMQVVSTGSTAQCNPRPGEGQSSWSTLPRSRRARDRRRQQQRRPRRRPLALGAGPEHDHARRGRERCHCRTGVCVVVRARRHARLRAPRHPTAPAPAP